MQRKELRALKRIYATPTMRRIISWISRLFINTAGINKHTAQNMT